MALRCTRSALPPSSLSELPSSRWRERLRFAFFFAFAFFFFAFAFFLWSFLCFLCLEDEEEEDLCFLSLFDGLCFFFPCACLRRLCCLPSPSSSSSSSLLLPLLLPSLLLLLLLLLSLSLPLLSLPLYSSLAEPAGTLVPDIGASSSSLPRLRLEEEEEDDDELMITAHSRTA